MNSKGSVVQSSRRASTTSRCPMNRMGLRFPVPCKRTTRFFLRSFGPATWMSPSAKPPSRRRVAIASAAVVTLPTESVVLISMSCLKISRASCFVCSGRSEEHTSELQSRRDLVCRLLLEKKKKKHHKPIYHKKKKKKTSQQ